LAFALLLALGANAFLAVLLAGARPLPTAAGQTASEGKPFVMGTEKTADGLPVCFVLSGDPPHLLVYRVDNAGLLTLSSSRDIHCDLKLPDQHSARGVGPGTRTAPPVAAVCAAVDKLPPPKPDGSAKKEAGEDEKSKDVTGEGEEEAGK